jgi:hypothetical protein
VYANRFGRRQYAQHATNGVICLATCRYSPRRGRLVRRGGHPIDWPVA